MHDRIDGSPMIKNCIKKKVLFVVGHVGIFLISIFQVTNKMGLTVSDKYGSAVGTFTQSDKNPHTIWHSSHSYIAIILITH